MSGCGFASYDILMVCTRWVGVRVCGAKSLPRYQGRYISDRSLLLPLTAESYLVASQPLTYGPTQYLNLSLAHPTLGFQCLGTLVLLISLFRRRQVDGLVTVDILRSLLTSQVSRQGRRIPHSFLGGVKRSPFFTPVALSYCVRRLHRHTGTSK